MQVVEICRALGRETIAPAKRHFLGYAANGRRNFGREAMAQVRIGSIARQKKHRSATNWLRQLRPPKLILLHFFLRFGRAAGAQLPHAEASNRAGSWGCFSYAARVDASCRSISAF